MRMMFQSPYEDYPYLDQRHCCTANRHRGRFSPLTRITPTWTGWVIRFGPDVLLFQSPYEDYPYLDPATTAGPQSGDKTFQSPYEDYPYLDLVPQRSQHPGSGRFSPLTRITPTWTATTGQYRWRR